MVVRRKIVSILISLFLSSSFNITAEAVPSNKAILDEGNEYFKSGRYQDAARAYRKAVDESPDDLAAWENLGWAYWRSGDLTEAECVWSNLLKLKHDDFGLLNKAAGFYTSIGKPSEAISLYEKSLLLNPDQRDIKYRLAKAYYCIGNYDKAISFAKEISGDLSDDTELKVIIAQSLSESSRYAEAEAAWKELSDKDKNISDYKVKLSKLLYEKGDYSAAENIVNDALEKDPSSANALRQSIRYSMDKRDYAKVRSIISKMIDDNTATADDILIFADACSKMLDHSACIKACDKIVAGQGGPKDEAILLRADAYLMAEDFKAALEDYKELRSMNPGNINVLYGLYYTYICIQDYRSAFETLSDIRSTEPQGYDIENEFNEAILYSYGGDYKKAEAILRALGEIDEDSVMPVLLYHGIDKDKGGLGIPLDIFRSHMKALKDEGYHTISLNEFLEARKSGDYPLPPKPIMITFDDGRRDSFELSDPILKELGFRAAMFVPIALIEKNSSLYLTYDDLKELLRTGRWDIGSHGLEGHSRASINSTGTKGDFLTNRLWLKNSERLENDDEFKARIEKDYAASRKVLEERLGCCEISSYAFPRNNYGQIGFPNVPYARELNLEMASKYYSLVFYQSKYSYNLRGCNLNGDRSPFVRRLSVETDKTADQLIDELKTSMPSYKANLYLGNIACWSGKYKKAEKFYSSLSKQVAGKDLCIAEGNLSRSRGDIRSARRDYERALEIDPVNRAAKAALDKISVFRRPIIIPQLRYFGDNRDRTTLAQDYELNLPVSDSVIATAAYGHTYFHETGMSDISDNSGRAGFTIRKDNDQYLNVGMKYRYFTNGNNDPLYFANLGFVVGDFSTWTLRSSKDYVETVEAINGGIKYYRNTLRAAIELNENMRTVVTCDQMSYSDDNQAGRMNFGLYFPVVKKNPSLTVGYGLVYGDSKYNPEAYYSWQNLFVQEVRISASFKMFGMTIREDYNAGYGREASIYRFSQSTSTYVEWRLADDFELFSSFDYSITPDYRGETAIAGLRKRF